MELQNLAYAVAQIVHNFGAVAIVGGSATAIALAEASVRYRISKLVAAGWLVQIVSGAAFGAISYYYYAAFPELSGIAELALIAKIACAVSAILLTGYQLTRPVVARFGSVYWIVTCMLGVVALCCAAVLRWFS